MNTCLFSCLIFLTNVFFSILYGYNILGLLFLLVTISSVYFHSNYTTFSYLIDQIFVINVIIYGFYLSYLKCLTCAYDEKLLYKFIIASCILSNFILFHYGRLYNKFCYDKKYGSYYHSLLHILASISYHVVIIM